VWALDKTGAVIFPMQAMLPENRPFSQISLAFAFLFFGGLSRQPIHEKMQSSSKHLVK